MQRTDTLGFAKRIAFAVVSFVLSGCAEFLRTRYELPMQWVVVSVLWQILFAVIGLSFLAWAILALFWADAKGVLKLFSSKDNSAVKR